MIDLYPPYHPLFCHQVLLLGNSGVGKSTLGNWLLQQPCFKAGPVTDGGGLTKTHEMCTVKELDPSDCLEKNVTYGTIPGPDITGETIDAVKIIEKALKMGGKYKLIFVVTTDGGRIRERDLLTKNMILEALTKVIGLEYAIVVNKLSPTMRKKLVQDKNTFLNALNSGCPDGMATPHIHFLSRQNEIEDDPLGILDPDSSDFEELKLFIAYLPFIEIKPKMVTKIDSSGFLPGEVKTVKGILKQLNEEHNDCTEMFKKYKKQYQKQLIALYSRAQTGRFKNKTKCLKVYLYRAFPYLQYVASALSIAINATKASPLLIAGA